ncbi:hypothetical protein [Luteibacter aegosomatissinici]|uniref:hypothetical protein n=1 Tax=Luteibacter aegosomatissinici TaxID=2911539 RepID=UPI001FFB788B|nr:hypothetical protein [Luteibacter aegosomatissinici]UPG94757.1 hypothetical protein L2Y97_01235 [Luteibacter aegosomatissinici]
MITTTRALTGIILSFSLSGEAVASNAPPSPPVTLSQPQAVAATRNDLRGLPPDKQRVYAAAHFLGYYQTNSMAAAPVCNAFHVDISPFVTAFRKVYQAEYSTALAILKEAGATDDTLDQMEARQRPRQEENVQRAMGELAQTQGATGAEAGCRYVAAHPDDVASARTYEADNPEVIAILMTKK